MKKLVFAVLVLLMLFAVPGVSFADRSYDFSDLESFRLQLPFTVTGVDRSGQGIEERQAYHVSESYEKVMETFSAIYDKNKTVGEFYILGLTEQMGEPMYQLQFAYKNEHHYAQVRPEGSGTVITVEIFPMSYISSVYGIASYGFHMPDGGTVMPVVATEE